MAAVPSSVASSHVGHSAVATAVSLSLGLGDGLGVGSALVVSDTLGLADGLVASGVDAQPARSSRAIAAGAIASLMGPR